MKLVKATIAAATFGLSVNAFAAVSDLSYVKHVSQSGQELKVGQIAAPRWSNRNAVTRETHSQAKPFAEAADNYRFGNITSVTHN